MKHLFFILILVLLVSCSPSYISILPQETQLLIPPNANKVVLKSDISYENIYNETLSVLIGENFRIENFNKEIGYISTEGKNIGEGTILRMNIKINKSNDCVELSSSSEWMADAETMALVNGVFGGNLQQEWKPASKENVGKPDYAFEKMILIIDKIPHNEIIFLNEK